MENFIGKVVMVTGAGGGLGRETALAFARAGATLSLADVNGESLAETVNRIHDLNAPEPMSTVVDLSGRAACHNLVNDTVTQLGGLDVLCNVAGILLVDKLENVTERDWDKTLAVNLSAPFWLSQAAIPHLLERNGNIVNVASSGAFIGESYVVPYTATKAGIVQMTKSMAMEFIKTGIRINAVAPGTMNTPMANPDNFPTDLDMELIQQFMPVRPPAEPAQVADLILYVASDRAANIHGACLLSDGGHTAG